MKKPGYFPQDPPERTEEEASRTAAELAKGKGLTLGESIKILIGEERLKDDSDQSEHDVLKDIVHTINRINERLKTLESDFRKEQIATREVGVALNSGLEALFEKIKVLQYNDQMNTEHSSSEGPSSRIEDGGTQPNVEGLTPEFAMAFTQAFLADDPAKAIGECLDAFRASTGPSKNEIARRMGQDASSLRKLETGRHNPQVDKISKYIKAVLKT